MYVLQYAAKFDAKKLRYVANTGSLLRIDKDGSKHPLVTRLMFPTALTIGPDGAIYLSDFGNESNFGEGVILRVVPGDTAVVAPAVPLPKVHGTYDIPKSNETLGPGANVAGAVKVDIVEPKAVLKWGYSPKLIRAKVGQKVVFTNTGLISHTATSKTGAFDTGLIKHNRSAVVVLNEAGIVRAHLHPAPVDEGDDSRQRQVGRRIAGRGGRGRQGEVALGRPRRGRARRRRDHRRRLRPRLVRPPPDRANEPLLLVARAPRRPPHPDRRRRLGGRARRRGLRGQPPREAAEGRRLQPPRHRVQHGLEAPVGRSPDLLRPRDGRRLHLADPARDRQALRRRGRGLARTAREAALRDEDPVLLRPGPAVPRLGRQPHDVRDRDDERHGELPPDGDAVDPLTRERAAARHAPRRPVGGELRRPAGERGGPRQGRALHAADCRAAAHPRLRLGDRGVGAARDGDRHGRRRALGRLPARARLRRLDLRAEHRHDDRPRARDRLLADHGQPLPGRVTSRAARGTRSSGRSRPPAARSPSPGSRSR